MRAPIHMRSIMLGAMLVKRVCGDSGVKCPGTELCQLTALSIKYGQNPIGAPLDDLVAMVSVSITAMTRSAIGFKSWSYGGLMV